MNENQCSNQDMSMLFDRGLNLKILKMSPELFIFKQFRVTNFMQVTSSKLPSSCLNSDPRMIFLYP